MTRADLPDTLISTDWLDAHRDAPDLRIFECTAYLKYLPPGQDAPYRVVSGRSDYEQGHIEGAGFLDIQDELSDSSSPSHLRFTALPAEALAGAFARRGIGDDSRVVLYSRGRNVWATRVWWLLRSIGFDAVAVLDGGWEKWEREGRPTSTEEPASAPATLTPHPRPQLFLDSQAVREAMDEPDTCLINALDADIHRGENPRYGRPGRIPASVNVPASTLVDPDTNTFVSDDQAASIFREVGADPKGRTVLYCGGGIAATLDAFVLDRLGYGDLSIYDASMSEWARDESLPIETD
jgi:thiosulfate/3-mercaptopyruvate sulfurtransferase